MPVNDEIIIVAGLPRSGTSLMMQMLEAGGIEPVTDNIRGADLDNPKGYYEFEKVKTVAEDSSWLQERAAKLSKWYPYDTAPLEHFIIKDVPERGSAETKVISSFVSITECVRPAMLLQRSCKTV